LIDVNFDVQFENLCIISRYYVFEFPLWLAVWLQ